MKDNQAPKAIHLSEYKVPDYLVETTQLHFDLHPGFSLVTAELSLKRNPAAKTQSAPLVLKGADLELQGLAIDGEALSENQYAIEGEELTIDSVPEKFLLTINTRIKPEENTSLEGLYQSNGMYCTQCEAEGFRKITYYLDRPDVMSVFTTTVEADKEKYPVLLSNGNPVARGEKEGGRHWVTWEDPFKKPCYLFALVAGSLSCVEDTFTTMSGREIKLEIFVEPQDLEKCDHAMLALKNSMAWDEKVYGREYDLDIYMIVAVSHFNMGAMENKGLNVFNTSCVLAHPKTTTDMGFQRVEGVIAHEYFHNWSGNRVTCRDWFQLSLKEGFTVFRDQEFSADMGSRPVKRVEDVDILRTVQFAEDAGPMAHPIRPASYIEINNFYTVTVYEKGAEVVRMIQTLVGPEGFRKGSDLYFERHDGQAVTTEDFVKAMEDANGVDLTQFKRWYDQAGTPKVKVSDSYSADTQQYELTIEQLCDPTPGQEGKKAFHIPIKLGLLDSKGNDLPLNLTASQTQFLAGDVLSLKETKQTFTFEGLKEKPIPSLGRSFSAPVHFEYDYSREQLAFLMSHDNDGFNRWDAGNRLATEVLLEGVASLSEGKGLTLDETLLGAFKSVLSNKELDKATTALLLSLPSEAYLAQQMEPVDVDGIHTARSQLKVALAKALRSEFLSSYQENKHEGDYSPEFTQIAQRSLKNLSLSYLMALEDDEVTKLCVEQFESADNMTDQNSAFRFLVHSDRAEKNTAIESFYQQWKHEPLVVDQWLNIQASSPIGNTLERVEELMQHECFELTNPNKVRALVGAFCNANPVNFHKIDGSGYRFLADRVIELNKLNPQIAARLSGMMSRWRKYDEARQALIVGELKRIMAEPNLSPDVYEVASKSVS